MRGDDRQQDGRFSYLSPEQRVPRNHPLRRLRPLVDEVLSALSGRFSKMYARVGRPSIAPEKLLRALLLQGLYSVRSERLLMEQLDYNLLFRWFVGLSMDDPVWDATVYSKNRERLLQADLAQAFFEQVVDLARRHDLLSDEHFTVDGTLIEAWAGQKSFKKKEVSPAPPGDDACNPSVDFRGEKRSNDTHASTTDRDARLFKKAKGQKRASRTAIIISNIKPFDRPELALCLIKAAWAEKVQPAIQPGRIGPLSVQVPLQTCTPHMPNGEFRPDRAQLGATLSYERLIFLMTNPQISGEKA